MKNICIIFVPGLFMMISVNLFGQQVISSGGFSGTGTNTQLSWTIGEPLIETFNSGTHILTQGFQQSKLVVTAIESFIQTGLTLTVYPNPVSSHLILDTKGNEMDKLTFRLYDIKGNLLLNKTCENQPELINMESYLPGAYFLKVFRNQNEPIKTFKVLKN